MIYTYMNNVTSTACVSMVWHDCEKKTKRDAGALRANAGGQENRATYVQSQMDMVSYYISY